MPRGLYSRRRFEPQWAPVRLGRPEEVAKSLDHKGMTLALYGLGSVP